MTNPSLSGQRFGAYEVGPLIGVGGMGEVYRARDAKLNRDVAIKVLLPAVAADAERLARFRREAQTLASLNHSGIAQIHGLEDSASGPFLVMELVDGPTLADRIATGAIPVDEAIAIARQIVDALEAAHERGIIHRDLKPANIKVRDDGAVKILDFGLAKALDPQSGGAAGSTANSPTITSPAMTQAGLILGTAAYMSPEQAKGRVVDKRTDVWAFGCVLYEMLTARRAFDGEDVTDTIAAVVRGEPDWSALPKDTPSQIRLLLRRCLDKDRRTRISDISVARFVMNERIDSSDLAPTAATWPSQRRVAIATAAGLLAGAALVAAAWALSALSPVSPVRAVRFTITPSAEQPLLVVNNSRAVAMAPDGSYLVYTSRVSQGPAQLVLRRVDEIEARPLPGTVGARMPFISPDGRWIGFQAENELRKVAVDGGGVVPICRLDGPSRGASWGDDGFILLATIRGVLYRVAADGGEPKPLTTADPPSGEAHFLPHVLPGSRWALFTVLTDAVVQAGRIDALNLVNGERKMVIRSGHDPAYLDSGFLVYAVTDQRTAADTQLRGSLRAVRFDPIRAEVMGDSIEVLGPLSVDSIGAANYSVSRRGDLSSATGGAGASTSPVRTLVWVDRKGKETPIPAEPRSYAVARISPDGTRIVLDLRDQTNDMWIWHVARQTLMPLNRDPGQDLSPLWTPDSKRIIWTSNRGRGVPNLFWQAADGSGVPERLTTNATVQFPTSITSDGATVLLYSSTGGDMDIFRVSIAAKDRKAEPLISGPWVAYGPEISPDGKWLAYHSNESGEFQVYVRSFPNVDGVRSQVSTAGGTRAAWARSGRELFFLDRDDLLTAVSVKVTGDTFSAGVPVKILNTRYYSGATLGGLDLRAYDVSADAQRFLMIKDGDAVNRTNESPASMVVVMNWVEELKARLPSR